jgi:hypothetical protein
LNFYPISKKDKTGNLGEQTMAFKVTLKFEIDKVDEEGKESNFYDNTSVYYNLDRAAMLWIEQKLVNVLDEMVDDGKTLAAMKGEISEDEIAQLDAAKDRGE